MMFVHSFELISLSHSNLATDCARFYFLISHFLNNSVSANRRDSFLELRTMMMKDLS